MIQTSLGLGQPLLNVGRHELEGGRLVPGRRRRSAGRTGVDRRGHDHARLVVLVAAGIAATGKAAVLGAPRSVPSGHRRGSVGTDHRRAGCRGTAATTASSINSATASAVARGQPALRRTGSHTAVAIHTNTPTATDAPTVGRVGRDEARLVVGRRVVTATAGRAGRGKAAVGRVRRQAVPLAAGVSAHGGWMIICLFGSKKVIVSVPAEQDQPENLN